MSRAFMMCVLVAAIIGCCWLMSCRDLLLVIGRECGLYQGEVVEVIPAPKENSIFLERSKARDRLVEHVVTEQLSLSDAAEDARRILGVECSRILLHISGQTEEEKLRRIVILWIETNESPRVQQEAQRLWCEMETWLAMCADRPQVVYP